MKTVVNVLLYLAAISFIVGVITRALGSAVIPLIPFLSTTGLLKFVFCCLGFAITLTLIQIRDK